MNERGGAIYGFLAAIGLVIVLLALFMAGCFANAGASSRRCDRRHERRCRDDGDQNTCFAGCNNVIVVPNPLEGTTTTTGGSNHE